MKVISNFFEIAPLVSTFCPAIISTFYDAGKKWQNFILALLGTLFLFFFWIFLTQEFALNMEPLSFFDIRYNKFSVFIALVYCGSLLIGLYPIRKSLNLSSSFLFYIAGGLGIILANNLPTFFAFWTFQRFIPVRGFMKEATGGTYIFQHVVTFLCFIALMFLAAQEGILTTPMTEMPASFFTWPVLVLSFIIVYESHGIFPFHSWVHDVVRNLPWYEFSAIFLTRAGVLLFVQLILPSMKFNPDIFNILLLTLSIVSSLYWSFRGILESRISIKTNYFYIAQASLLLTGMQADLTAAQGSYLHMMVISIAGTSIFSMLSYVQHTFSFKRASQFFGLSRYYPRLATLFCLFGFCMIGVPLGASFVVEDLVITGLLHYHPFLGLGHIMATCLNGILFFLIFTKVFLGPSPYKEEVANFDMDLMEMVPYLAGLFLLLLIGILPSLFLEKIVW